MYIIRKRIERRIKKKKWSDWSKEDSYKWSDWSKEDIEKIFHVKHTHVKQLFHACGKV